MSNGNAKARGKAIEGDFGAQFRLFFLSLSTLSEAEKALRCLAVFTLTEKK